MLTVMLAGWANYLSPLARSEGFLIKGQSLGVVIPLVGFPFTVILWLLYRRRQRADLFLTVFLAGLSLAWVIHVLIERLHSDQVAHTIWLFLPLIIMLWWKPPSASQCLTVIYALAWTATVILISTRIMEMLSLVRVFHIDPEIVAGEKQRYWLPLSNLFGIDGRWPGPFGYNSKTGFVGTLLVIIGFVQIRWQSWIFISVGLVTVLLTSGRGAALALFCGLGVLIVFSLRGPLSKIPIGLRASVVAAGVACFLVLQFLGPLRTTGRLGEDGIWGHFVSLWRTSPWIGVGQTGILADPKAGISMEAHNLFLQELTRYGLAGLFLQYLPVVLGVTMAAVAAYKGVAWPLALLGAYFAASLTEVFQDGWLLFSTYTLLVTLCVIAASNPGPLTHGTGNPLSTRAGESQTPAYPDP
jgi:hypothetical protein